MERRQFLNLSLALPTLALAGQGFGRGARWRHGRDYKFNRAISREVLGNYLSRAICMEGLLNGRGDFNENIRMLHHLGAKYIGRSICLWGGEENLLRTSSGRSSSFRRSERPVRR